MGDWIRFGGNDPWFYMRLVDNLAHNFPHRILFDPYGIYPGGSNIGIPPFFLMLLGSTTWVIGLGSPSENIIETVGAYFPAILGAPSGIYRPTYRRGPLQHYSSPIPDTGNQTRKGE